MTALQNSQLSAVAVASNPAAAGLKASQLSAIAVASNPAAAGLQVSQFAAIAVIANGKQFLPLGPCIQLNCWTPCANLAHRS